MLKEDDKRLYDFLCYKVDEDFQDVFTEFIHELSCVDLSENTLNNLYELFIKDMRIYFEKKAAENKANKYESLVNKIKKKFAKSQEEYELLLESQSGQESNRTKYLRGKIHTCQELLEKLEGE